jgi:hypothetical protein
VLLLVLHHQRGPPLISARNLVTVHVRAVKSIKLPGIKSGNKEHKKTQEKTNKKMRIGRCKI